MTRTHSSRMKQTFVAASCAATMAISGFSVFSPKNDTILGPGNANAQGSMPSVSFPSYGSLPSPGGIPSIPSVPWYTVPDYGAPSRPKSRRELEIEKQAGDDGLRSEDSGKQADATRALVIIGKPAISALTEALTDGNSSVRWHAVWALGDIAAAKPKDPKTLDIVLALTGVMNDKDEAVRRHVAEALEKVKKAREPKANHARRKDCCAGRASTGHGIDPSQVDIMEQLKGVGHFPY